MSFKVFQAQGLRIYTGDTATVNQYVGLAGELAITTDNKSIRILDGINPGGTPLTTANGAELQGLNIEQLANLLVSAPQDGQALVYEGGKWKNKAVAASGSGGASHVNDLVDVKLTNLQTGEVLSYNASILKWENKPVAAADHNHDSKYQLKGNYLRDTSNLGEVNDVQITMPANDQVLSYNASTSKWENVNLDNIQASGGNKIMTIGVSGTQANYYFGRDITFTVSTTTALSGVTIADMSYSIDGATPVSFASSGTGSFTFQENTLVTHASNPTYTEIKDVVITVTDSLGNTESKTMSLTFVLPAPSPSLGPNTTNTTYSNYNVYTITSSDYLNLHQDTVFDVLIVGGGACGDKGGGGAGGVREWTSMVFPAGEYSIDIGGGGSPSSLSGNPTEITFDTPYDGGSFTTITASAGGKGAGSASGSMVGGDSGGSGGGAIARGLAASNYNQKGSGNVGGNTSAVNGGTPVNTVEGYAGGNAPTNDYLGCGGGGGAAGAGGNGGTGSIVGNSGEGGNGGLAYSTSIRNGVSEWFAGGGGGSGKSSSGGVHYSLGGGTTTALQKGGGTDGSYEQGYKAPDSGANTGGGSGGHGWGGGQLIGAGGSGIVILRTTQYM